jgi:hypothetical protein
MSDYLNLGSDGNAAPMANQNGLGRALDSTFTPNLARPTLCIFSIRITTTGAGQRGRVEFRCDNVANPPVTAQARIASGDFSGSTEQLLWFLVPPGWRCRLTTVNEAGAPTFTINAQTELTL